MNKEKLHELLKQAKGAISVSLASAPATLLFIAASAALTATEAKAWSAQYGNIGREVGREIGRDATDGKRDGVARLAVLIGGAVGTAIAKPLDDRAKRQEEERKEALRHDRAQSREALANQRRLERAEMLGREKAIRENAYNKQRLLNGGAVYPSQNSQPALQPGSISPDVWRQHENEKPSQQWRRVTPGANLQQLQQRGISYARLNEVSQAASSRYWQGSQLHAQTALVNEAIVPRQR